MYKYLCFVILGIIIYLYNRKENFSVGGPNYLFLQKHTSDVMGSWEVKDTMDPALDLSQYERRFKTTYEFPDLNEVRSNMWMTTEPDFRDQIVNTTDTNFCLNNPIFLDAVETLDRLNERLTSKCPTLRMVLDKPENLTDDLDSINEIIENVGEIIDRVQLVICLYHNDECISLLTIKISNINNTITISRITKPQYEGNKYMSLLSSVLMICADKLIYCNKIIKVDAVCYNSITLYYFIKNFNYILNFYDNNLLETEYNRIIPITRENLTNLQTILDRYSGLHVVIELTPENIAIAQALFDRLVSDSDNSIVCPNIIEISPCSVITNIITIDYYQRVERLYYTIEDIDVGRDFTIEDYERVIDTIGPERNIRDIDDDILIDILTQLFGS